MYEGGDELRCDAREWLTWRKGVEGEKRVMGRERGKGDARRSRPACWFWFLHVDTDGE